MKKTILLCGVLALAGCGGGGGGGGNGGGLSVATTTSQTNPNASSTGSTAPAVPMDVRLAAPRQTVKVGDLVEVRVDATAVAGLYGAGLDVSYDPAVLEFQDVQAGGLIPGATVGGGLRAGKPGVVTIAAAAEGKAAGGSGSGTIVTLRFKAKAAGRTAVDPVDVVLEDAQGSLGTSSGLGPLGITVQ